MSSSSVSTISHSVELLRLAWTLLCILAGFEFEIPLVPASQAAKMAGLPSQAGPQLVHLKLSLFFRKWN